MNQVHNVVYMPDRGKRLLVVEDNPSERQAAAAFLRSSYQVVDVSSLKQAQDALDSGTLFDAIITDICLDDGDPMNRDGLVLLESTCERNLRIPVIVVTTYGVSQTLKEEKAIKLEAYTLGASEVLTKPLDLEALACCLSLEFKGKHLARRRRARELLSYVWPPMLVLLLFLLGWELICRLLHIKDYLVPAPSRIWAEMVDNAESLLIDTGITMSEAALGFILANVLSLLVAIGFSHSKWFERSFYPYVIALKSIPVIAIAPLLVLWCGYGMLGKVVMAGIISFFPLVVNATLGLKSADGEALELMQSLSASKRQIFFMLRLPTALPHIFSGLKISSALAVMGALVAELTGASAGLGYTMMLASYNVGTPLLFAAVVIASLCGIAFFGLIVLLEVVSNLNEHNIQKRESSII